MSSNSGGRRTRRVAASGRMVTRFIVKAGDFMVVPAPDVCRHQRGHRQSGGHNGDPGHEAVHWNRRPRLDTAFEAAEQMEDYAEWLVDCAAEEAEKQTVVEVEVASAPAQLRRAHVTHEGHVLVESLQGSIELHKKAA